MNSKLNKLFSNSKFMLITGVISALLFVGSNVPYIFAEGYELYRLDVFIEILLAALIIGLLIAFKKGEINIQKALMGALLFFFFNETFTNVIYSIEFYMNGYEGYLSSIVLLSICGVLELGIIVAHLIMQTDHEGSEKAISLSRVCTILLIIFDIVDIVRYSINMENIYLLTNLAETFLLIMIACMETKIQIYKKTRSDALKNGTWTTEAKNEAKKIFKI